ncbi:sigma-70 family RNA polymerase sigma factor [Burkholderia vietnamiensis]|uniref:sigma-70 family RNA polymerase sigma factor n=1 Tax=Burkholderia vietnamiensis TaxID=60552 RepID=UPI000841818C|nr:sigma-70 family RNA polymerase sigma factor [Burkholderia vietnamiensis]AOK02343.1 RNA polymerase subunit sigma-24 [Burkholderia vietnamiensis]
MNCSHESLRPSSAHGRAKPLHSARQQRRGAAHSRSHAAGADAFADDTAQREPDEQAVWHAALDSLLCRVAAGDEQAFAQLYRFTSARLYCVIVRMIRDRHEAEDLLQEVFTTAWRRAGAFDAERGTAMTWLLTLARNRTIDRLRQHRDAPLDEEQALLIPDEGPTPDAGAQASQERQRLERGLAHLGERQAYVLREAFHGGASYAELAERMQVPLGTMKSWIRRSLLRLRIYLEQ